MAEAAQVPVAESAAAPAAVSALAVAWDRAPVPEVARAVEAREPARDPTAAWCLR